MKPKQLTDEDRVRVRMLRLRGGIPRGIELHVYPDGAIGWVPAGNHRYWQERGE